MVAKTESTSWGICVIIVLSHWMCTMEGTDWVNPGRRNHHSYRVCCNHPLWSNLWQLTAALDEERRLKFTSWDLQHSQKEGELRPNIFYKVSILLLIFSIIMSCLKCPDIQVSQWGYSYTNPFYLKDRCSQYGGNVKRIFKKNAKWIGNGLLEKCYP